MHLLFDAGELSGALEVLNDAVFPPTGGQRATQRFDAAAGDSVGAANE